MTPGCLWNICVAVQEPRTHCGSKSVWGWGVGMEKRGQGLGVGMVDKSVGGQDRSLFRELMPGIGGAKTSIPSTVLLPSLFLLHRDGTWDGDLRPWATSRQDQVARPLGPLCSNEFKQETNERGREEKEMVRRRRMCRGGRVGWVWIGE